MVTPRSSCCCGIGLKAMNIVIGCLEVIITCVLLILFYVMLYLFSTVEEEMVKVRKAGVNPCVVTSVLVVIFFLKFFVDVLFIYGVAKEKIKIVRASFFVWSGFFLLLMVTFSLNSPPYNVSTIALEISYMCLNVYLMHLSYSYYHELLNKSAAV